MSRVVTAALLGLLVAAVTNAGAQRTPPPPADLRAGAGVSAAVPPSLRLAPGLPQGYRSRVDVLHGLALPRLDARRDVRVYLPPSYQTGDRRYPVLYLQDGQTLFGGWDVQALADSLARGGTELILVAVDHAGTARLDEYTVSPDREQRGGAGARYLDDLVRAVKPAIDARYRTLTSARHTGIAGTDLGGLISVEAGLRYPDVFGFVGALSPEVAWNDSSVVREVWTRPRAGQAYYLSVGTREGDGDPDRDLARLMDAGQLLWALGAQGARVGYFEVEGDGRVPTSLRSRLSGLLRGFHSYAMN